MLAGVTDCRRSRKWGCRGRWALGFKPTRGSHREDHVVLKEQRGDHEVLGKKGEDHAALAK